MRCLETKCRWTSSMMSRLSRRSVLGAALTSASGTGLSWRSGGPDDVDHEVQRVRALDVGARRTRLAVAVLGWDREDHLAADPLADQRLVPALDHLADADLEGGGGGGV